MAERKDKQHEEALAAFMAAKLEIDELLVRLQTASDDHFDADPDRLNWGDVGSITQLRATLRELCDQVFREGDYAQSVTA